jgi:hypothetical protein
MLVCVADDLSRAARERGVPVASTSANIPSDGFWATSRRDDAGARAGCAMQQSGRPEPRQPRRRQAATSTGRARGRGDRTPRHVDVLPRS